MQYLIQCEFGPDAEPQQYIDRFAKWALENPDEFSGPKSRLIRIGHGEYKLDDNPER